MTVQRIVLLVISRMRETVNIPATSALNVEGDPMTDKKQACVYRDRNDWLRDGTNCGLCVGPCKWENPAPKEPETPRAPEMHEWDKASREYFGLPAPKEPDAMQKAGAELLSDFPMTMRPDPKKKVKE